MRCPRCQLTAIPEGAQTCVRCGYAPPAPRGAPGAIPGAAAPEQRASGAPGAPRPERFQTKPRSGPAPPVVIMDDGHGDEDEDDDDDRDWAPRPARRLGARVVAAVGVTIALGSGAVWLNTASVPAPFASPDTLGPASATPAVATPAPADTAVARAAEPRAPIAAAPLPSSARPPVTRPSTPRRTASPPSRVTRPADPALLSINAVPWGSVYIDGRPVGNTPQLDRPVAPGSHALRVEREGFRPYQRMIEVAPGQHLRIVDITLVER